MTTFARALLAGACIAMMAAFVGCGGGGGADGGGGDNGGLPEAPTNLRTTGTTQNTITIAWTDQSSGQAGFEVQRRQPGGTFQTIDNLSAGTEQSTDDGLDPATTYEYRVRATAASGNSAWVGPISATTGSGDNGVPAAPTGLGVSATTQSSVTLAWTDNSSIETGFEVQRRSNGTWMQVGTPGVNAQEHTDSGLTLRTVYEYRVRALGDSGDSIWSNVVPTAPGDTGGTGTVTGRVVTLSSDTPISGATVDLGGPFYTTTGSDGTYTIGDVPTAPLTMNVSAPDYESASADITVHTGVNDLGDTPLASSGSMPPPPPIF